MDLNRELGLDLCVAAAKASLSHMASPSHAKIILDTAKIRDWFQQQPDAVRRKLTESDEMLRATLGFEDFWRAIVQFERPIQDSFIPESSLYGALNIQPSVSHVCIST